MIVAPIFLFISLLSLPIVNVLFGQKWVDVVPVLQVLSFYGFFRAIGNPIGSLVLAKGRADIGFFWNLAMLFCVPLSILCGSYMGLVGVSWALLGLAVALKLPEYYLITKPLCDAGFNEYLKSFSKPLLMVFIIGFVLLPLMSISNIFYMSASVLFVGVAMYLFLLYVFERDFRFFVNSRDFSGLMWRK